MNLAQRLKLTEHTVKNYLFRIFDKLGVSSRVEVVLYALGSGTAPHAGRSSASGPSRPVTSVSAKSRALQVAARKTTT